MLVIVGYLVVAGAVFGGYALMGGHFGVLFHPREVKNVLLIGAGAASQAGMIGPVSTLFLGAVILIAVLINARDRKKEGRQILPLHLDSHSPVRSAA